MFAHASFGILTAAVYTSCYAALNNDFGRSCFNINILKLKGREIKVTSLIINVGWKSLRPKTRRENGHSSSQLRIYSHLHSNTDVSLFKHLQIVQPNCFFSAGSVIKRQVVDRNDRLIGPTWKSSSRYTWLCIWTHCWQLSAENCWTAELHFSHAQFGQTQTEQPLELLLTYLRFKERDTHRAKYRTHWGNGWKSRAKISKSKPD